MIGLQNDALHAGEAARAFEEWVSTHQAELFSFVYGAIGDRNEADDIAVEAFAQVHALAGQNRIKDTPLAELYRIAIREAARRLSVRPRLSREDRRQLVWRTLMRLDENERLILLLRESAGYSLLQIAACLRASEDEVKAQLFGARQSFAAACRCLDHQEFTGHRRHD